jgi:hypothetical protein
MLLYIQTICINNINVCFKIKICRIGEDKVEKDFINNIMIFIIITKEIYCIFVITYNSLYLKYSIGEIITIIIIHLNTILQTIKEICLKYGNILL